MPYRDPLSAQALAVHQRRLRRCIGSACVVEALSTSGLTSIRRLEAFFRGGTPPLDATGKPMWSGLCKRWRNGVALPSNAMCDRATQMTNGRARLQYWRDHALWRLIAEPNELGARQIVEMLWQLPEHVSRVLFLSLHRSRPILGEISEEQLVELRQMRSLDALVALLGLARLAEQMCNDERHAVVAASAFSILAPVVRSSPQLTTSSEHLFELLTTSFWSHWYLGGVRQELRYEAYRQHLHALALDPLAESATCIGCLRVDGPRDEREISAILAVFGLDMR